MALGGGSKQIPSCLVHHAGPIPEKAPQPQIRVSMTLDENALNVSVVPAFKALASFVGE